MKTLQNTGLYAAILFTFATLFTACQSSSQSGTAADTTNAKVKKGKITKRTQDGCYMYVSGNQMKDTLYVQLHIQNDNVSGRMIDDIFEKDGRKGTIAGTMKADKTINAVWTFMQEGVTDTMSVAFKMNHTGLLKKPFKADTKTGRQTTDASAPYSIELKPTDCNKE
jgi:hypothetical protein